MFKSTQVSQILERRTNHERGNKEKTYADYALLSTLQLTWLTKIQQDIDLFSTITYCEKGSFKKSEKSKGILKSHI